MQDLQYVPKGSTTPGVSCLFSRYMDLSNRSKSFFFFLSLLNWDFSWGFQVIHRFFWYSKVILSFILLNKMYSLYFMKI